MVTGVICVVDREDIPSRLGSGCDVGVGGYPPGAMHQLIILAAEAAHDTEAVDEQWLPIAVAMVGISMVLAFVTTWRITTKDDGAHH